MNVTLRLAGLWLATWSLAVCGGGASDEPVPQPSPQQSSWTLSWSDEFDAGSRPDESRWVYDLGGGGWGNQELQTYTSRADNAVLRDGALVITARAERLTGTDGIARDYTSARLKTKDRFAQTYGRFEARIQVPRGQGIWPAFWMLGADVDGAGWPQMRRDRHHGAHRPRADDGSRDAARAGLFGGSGPSGASPSPDGKPFADAFHVFAVEWEPGEIRWYLDGRQYFNRKASDLPAGARWVFDHDFFLLLNVAVGGDWPGNPDTTTTFPQEMKVDYVRAYRR